MAKEGEPSPKQVRSIHIDLQDRSIVVEATDQTGVKLSLTQQGIVYELLPTTPRVEPAVLTQPADTGAIESKENPMVTVKGRLKSQPREGRPDGSNKPTAWARFAAHEVGDDGISRARVYSATFHNDTRPIAMTLPQDAQLEIEGYPHPAPAEGKLDTFSVMAIRSFAHPKQQRPK